MKEPNTEKAWIIAIMAFTFGYVWASLFPNAPYLIFVEAVGASFVALGGKRLVQKLRKFGGKGDETIEIEKTVEGKSGDPLS